MAVKPMPYCANTAPYTPECDDCSALEARVTVAEEDIDALEGRMTDAEGDISSNTTLINNVSSQLSNYYTKNQVNNLLAGKQNLLTFDSTPTSGSTNPVTSGGVHSAIDALQLSSSHDSAGNVSIFLA